MRAVHSDKMPKSNGHYSQCIEHQGMLYLSGQLPFHPETRLIPEGIAAQALQVLQNIALILRESGSNKNQIIQMRIYIPDISLWEEVNKVYSDFFGNHKPARCVIPVRELHHGSLVEMEATAYVQE